MHGPHICFSFLFLTLNFKAYLCRLIVACLLLHHQRLKSWNPSVYPLICVATVELNRNVTVQLTVFAAGKITHVFPIYPDTKCLECHFLEFILGIYLAHYFIPKTSPSLMFYIWSETALPKRMHFFPSAHRIVQ